MRQPLIRNSFRQAHSPSRNASVRPINKHQIKSLSSWLVPFLTMIFGAFALRENLPLTSQLWSSAIIGVLLFLTAASADRDTRLRNISSLLMVAAITVAFAAFLSQNGFTLIGVEYALLVSALALVSAWILKSAPSGLLSVFAGLLYFASAFPELGLTTGILDQDSQLSGGLMPWLILGQILLARKIRSYLVLFTAVIAGYLWLTTLANEMPWTALAGLGFAVAAAHYWVGKAWAETEKFGADIHHVCAWVFAMGAALYIQSLWLSSDSGQAKPFWLPNFMWWAGLTTAILTLFVASLMRYKTSRISLPGIFIICLVVIALPVTTAKPDIIHLVFEMIPGLNARPGLGLIIGAVILATGLIWLVRGIKSGSFLDMSIGALAIGIESVILFHSAKFDTDLGVIFIVSLICALCIGGLIAGTSGAERRSIGNYA